MMMALLPAKRDGSLFGWKQPIENMFAAQAPKLWSPEPGTSSEAVRGQEIRSEWWRSSNAIRKRCLRIRRDTRASLVLDFLTRCRLEP
jgi:hypothetical protein